MAANKFIIIPLKHHFAIFEQQGVQNMLHYCCTVTHSAMPCAPLSCSYHVLM